LMRVIGCHRAQYTTIELCSTKVCICQLLCNECVGKGFEVICVGTPLACRFR
jgi:hypothetical protein